MASINDLLLMLHPPWSHSARSLLFDGLDDINWDDIPPSISGYMVIEEIFETGLSGHIASFRPFDGIQIVSPKIGCHIEASLTHNWFCKGMWIGFNDLKVQSGQPLVLTPSGYSSLWCIPEFDSNASLTYMNLFSGAFAGWERATTWLERKCISSTFRCISVDYEPQVIEMWKMQTNKLVLQSPVHYDFALDDPAIGILTCVSDTSILNVWRSAYNGVFSISPPCQCWSKGGKGSGLESKNGQTFLKAINTTCKARPIAALVECSDMVPKHVHFHIVKACFAFAGYRLVYSGILKLDDLSPMMRSRWFAIWQRADIQLSIPRPVVCSDPCRLGWNHSMYSFFIPEQLAHQLVVSAQLTNIYGSYKFLPVGMRKHCDNPDDPYAVLLSRAIKEHENIPTLCASYGSQHNLDSGHLEGKGIFAPLIQSAGSFQFVDPFRCAALLGATPHFGTAFSCNLVDAWANLGNSVSVPQALQVITILLKSLGICKFPIQDVVLQCWNDRFKADDTIVGLIHNAYWLLPSEQVPLFFAGEPFATKDVPRCQFMQSPIQCSVQSKSTFRQLFSSKGLLNTEQQALSLTHDSSKIEWDCDVDSFHEKTIICSHNDNPLMMISIDVVIPSTLPWTLEENINDADLICAIQKAEQDIAIQPTAKKARTTEAFDDLHPLDPKCVRLSLAIKHGVLVGDDEFRFYIKTFQECTDKIVFLNPIVESHGFRFPYLGHLLNDLGSKIDCICLPVLINDHWCAIEICRNDKSFAITFLNFRQVDRKASDIIFSKVCEQSSRPVRFKNATLPVPNGWCGWALVNRWVKVVKCISLASIPEQSSSKLSAVFRESTGIAESFHLLAYSARLRFLLQFVPTGDSKPVSFGGADEDDDMKELSSKDVDPWLKSDPWSTKKNCRWEDLKLPKDHPIHDAKGVRLAQHHRHQLGSNLGGVAFITKAMIPEVVAQLPKKPFALLLPASDKLVIDSFQLQASGPFEVIVEDPSSGATYKRQVMLAQVGSEVSFKLAKPTYAATLTEMSEIVLEIDARLALKDTIASFQEKALEAFKAKVVEQFPSKTTKNLNVYGFKHFKENSKKNQSEFYQAMCKIPTSERKAFLERSGIGEICARDFVPKGGAIQDATIIPRFWQCDKAGKEEAVRAASSLTGFGGLIITRRGIAVRAWVAQIGNIRSILMPHDDRICDLNRNVVPVITRESTGWPSSISASEVVKATFHATSQAPVPTRCYKSLGLTTWTLGFATPPAVKTFLAQFNEQTYEILITEPQDVVAPRTKSLKGKGKGKGQSNTQKNHVSNQEPSDQVLTDRVACLEAKFGGLERRQDQLEHRITSGFDGVQDQLRQVLQAVVPRQPQQSTGMTPPPKVAKTS